MLCYSQTFHSKALFWILLYTVFFSSIIIAIFWCTNRMRRYVFNKVKALIPKITPTEMIALRSGTTSIDREIFEGAVKVNKFDIPSERKVVKKHELDEMLELFPEKHIYPDGPYYALFKYLGHTGMFSFLIPPEYGGRKTSV